MKKLFAFFAAAVAASAILPAVADTWTDPSTGIEWHYEIANGEAKIINGSGYDEYSNPRAAVSGNVSGNVSIPETLGGKSVTAIGCCAFYFCDDITGVTIPSCVRKIEDKAFYGMGGLSSIEIPPSVTNLG